MPSTPNYALPYPALTDSPNVPADIQTLATAVDTEITRVDTDAAALEARESFVRVATSAIIADSSTFTTTETQVGSVVAALVNGRTYRIVADFGFQITVAGAIRVQVREDTIAGAVKQIRDAAIEVAATVTSIIAAFEYTAVATGNKAFVVTGDVLTGGGTANVNASGSIPSYLYVDYLRG